MDSIEKLTESLQSKSDDEENESQKDSTSACDNAET